MRPLHWRGALALLGLSLLAAGSFTGCGKVEDSRGGVMLLVSTDGPLAIDHLDISISVTDRSLLANKYRVPEEVALPTSVAIVSNGNPTAQATISVTGWAGSVPLDRRDAIVIQIPNDRVVALNVVLSARCSPRLTVSAEGNAVSSCGDGNTCDNSGACTSVIVHANELPTYRVGDENDAGFAGSSDGSSGGNGGESAVVGEDAAGAGGSAGGFSEGGAGGTDDGGAGGAAGAVGTPCGNHQPDPGEQCDDGGESTKCNANCTLSSCGDGIPNFTAGEQCDEGAKQTAHCEANCTIPRCGDRVLNMQAGELCDDGNTISGDGCNQDCTSTEKCGNGIRDPGEQCDDGAETAVCNTNCTKAACGDGITNSTRGEQCDGGGESATCNSDCTVAVCGDLKVNSHKGETCDPGGVDTATCDKDCTGAKCGDGYVNVAAGEECEPPSTTWCSATCGIKTK